MSTPEKFTEYARTVASQLRWKRAQNMVEREMTTHLLDQRDALIAEGMSEADAERESLRLTGDPAEIGTSLDRVHRPKPAWSIIIFTVLLAVGGFLLRNMLSRYLYFDYILEKELVLLAVAFAAFAGAYFLDFTILAKFAEAGYLGAVLSTFGLCILFGSTMGKFISAQFSTLLYPLTFAAVIWKLRGRRHFGLLIAGGALTLQAFTCLFIPSMFGFISTVVCGVALIIAAAAEDWFDTGRKRALLIVITTFLTITLVLIILAITHAPQRVELLLNPHSDPNGAGWIYIQVREALSHAKLIGRCESAALDILSQMHSSDNMLVLLVCNFGWLPFFALMAAFAVFFILILRLCLRQKSMLGRLVSLAVLLTLGAQTVLYSAAGLGWALFAVYSLPLISPGGSALVINMALIGCMLSVFRTGALMSDTRQARSLLNIPNFIRIEDGELILSFKRTRTDNTQA